MAIATSLRWTRRLRTQQLLVRVQATRQRWRASQPRRVRTIPPRRLSGLFSASTEEIVQIVRISERFQLPVVPFGAGTSLEGARPALPAVSRLTSSEMSRVLRVSPRISMRRVERCVTRLPTEQGPAKHRPDFPIDPGAGATIAG